MVIELCKYNGDKRRINKTLEGNTEVQGTLRDKCNLINPEIMIKTDPREFNYVYIEEFGKYYYIKDVTSYRQGMWVMQLKEDVLMTYGTQILNWTGVVSRLNGADYVNGSSVWDSRDLHQRIDWDDELKLGSHILVAKGGH